MKMQENARHHASVVLNPLKASLLALTLASGLSASAQTTTTSTNFTVGATVPDDDPSGVASAKIVSTPIAYVTKVKVNLKLSGTFNGDIYCYLAHGGTNSILLNRVGRSASSSLGYSDKGFDIVLDDAAANGDVHVYRTHTNTLGGTLIGSWVPDARRINPTNVVTTDSRAAFLNAFNGMNPNGEWVLFVADLEAGDIYTVDNWGLEITGYTPPSIVSAPANATAECALGGATFSVTAAGSAPLAYQWRHDSNPIPGATASSLTINPVSFADAGNYDVIITNNYGSITSPAATLTITDTTAPVADAASLSPVIAQCSASLPPAPTATDACDGQIIGVPDQLGPFGQGDTVITWTFTDSHGQFSTQTQAVHVHDTTPPVPNLATLPTVTGQCSAAIASAPTATDNCVGSVTGTTTDPLSYSAQGTYTVHWSYSDGRGNVSHQDQTVIVHDDQPPVPNVASLPTVTGECSATVTAPTATDACAGQITATTSDPLNYTAQGTYTVHWTYADGNGNSTAQSQTVIVHDVTAPVVSCPANITLFTTNEAGTAVNFTLPTASDNCGVDSVVASPVSGSNFPIGSNQVVTITATDVNGLTSQCTFTVTVVLNYAPEVEDITMGAVENHSRSLLLEKVIAHCFDPDDDQMYVSLPSNLSTNGGTVGFSQDHTAIVYTPVANFVGEDRFTYTVDDGKGGVSSATIIVEVLPADALTPNITGSYTTGGVFHIRFAGIPGFTYHIERTGSLSPASWGEIGTVNAPEDGQIDYGDTTAPQGSAFYRTDAPLQ